MTYREMAEVLNVTLCRGRKPTGHYCGEQHDKEGSVTPDGVVHFGRSGQALYRNHTLAFLRLVARSQEPDIDTDVPWRRVYRMNMKVRLLASFLHIKNPAHPAHGDRAFVLASVAGIPNSEPLRKEAFDWARRGPKEENDA